MSLKNYSWKVGWILSKLNQEPWYKPNGDSIKLWKSWTVTPLRTTKPLKIRRYIFYSGLLVCKELFWSGAKE